MQNMNSVNNQDMKATNLLFHSMLDKEIEFSVNHLSEFFDKNVLDPLKEIELTKHLGKNYRAKKNYFVAIAIYSYCLWMIRHQNHPSLNQKLWGKIEKVERGAWQELPPCREMEEPICYSQVNKYKSTLKRIRQETVLKLEDHQKIEDTYHFISSEYKTLLSQVLTDLIAQLGTPKKVLLLFVADHWQKIL